MSVSDTIAAIATPPGRGGIAITRVSGPEAVNAARTLTGTTPEPRHAYFHKFKQNNEVLDEGVVLYFPAPHSYTGEDVVEFQGHGGMVAPQRVLNAVLSMPGVRLAEPGEFTRRAFLNNKLDLTAAEAVEDLISAGSDSAARAALASLDGSFADRLSNLTRELTNLRVHLEACLDFPEEHEDFLDSGKALAVLRGLLQHAQTAALDATRGVRLNEGARMIIVGAPNAGKSSLLNALSGTSKAIVTSIPGTTRDLLTAQIEIAGIPVTLTDTAGIRSTPADEIESLGIDKALEALGKADLVLFVIDSSAPAPEAEEILGTIQSGKINPQNILIILSKYDRPACAETLNLVNTSDFSTLKKIKTSTKTESGLTKLYEELKQTLGLMPAEGTFSARRRHLLELNQTVSSLEKAIRILDGGDIVLCARELREAQDHLGTITGLVTSDDLLGKIFSTFCLGK